MGGNTGEQIRFLYNRAASELETYLKFFDEKFVFGIIALVIAIIGPSNILAQDANSISVPMIQPLAFETTGIAELKAIDPNIRVLLINIFAGITDLSEFSRLLVEALRQVPELNVPAVARLVGNGLPAARDVLQAAGIHLYTELDDALVEVRQHLEKGAAQ